ncbi:hypothetical protein [Xanthocytophaga flava]|uniref:hypothetical protein n=1 Tax=Xanthocytophaga flava TaxID=3048013 RepID=UPI0028D73D77|nr:hypothetical protein [Xanthocytophaga flavus]MDJ1470223.1 hypothetical protein [Xanthocytophaga flavus]
MYKHISTTLTDHRRSKHARAQRVREQRTRSEQAKASPKMRGTKAQGIMGHRKHWRKVMLIFLFSWISSAGFSQMVVADFYNSIINTISQTIQAASKIINSEAFKQATKVVEKLKEVHNGVQQFRRIQETAEFIQTSVDIYKKSLNVIAEDKHFSPSEVASFYSTLNKLAQQDSKLLKDLSSGIKANLVEMNSSERMQFIMKIHSDAAASSARLKAFVSGIEYMSLKRCRTTNDRLKTMSLYAVSRNTNGSGSAAQIDFGEYSSQGPDLSKLDEQARNEADALTEKEQAWLTDPNNPKAKQTAIQNLVNDPMPQKPNPKDPKIMFYQDLLEAWTKEHEQDLKILGTQKAYFVMETPPGLSEQEWMTVLLNKLDNGQL